jgi:RNA polymerase sigma-70 factor, ECF subfamily
MLRDLFLKKREVPAAEHDALERALAAAVEKASAAHPAVKLAPEEFVAFVAERAAWPLEGLHLDSLWLACACARGDAAAITAVERESFHLIDAAVAQVGGQRALADEVRQVLRERLFTRAGGREPRIAEYGGRGDLGRWVKAVAVRAAIDMLRAAPKETSDVDDLADRGMPDSDPELKMMKDRYGQDFKAAVREAIAGLAPEDRNDLRLYYVDGLGLDSLGAMYRVSTSTMSRRLAKTRERILESTKKIMRERLGVKDADVESILRLIESRLELSRSALKG